MKYRLLGNSGLKVSDLCLGTMTFGEEFGFGADRDECRRIYEAYTKAGGNFIDTANIYNAGTSERFLSEFIRADRARLVLATKFTMNANPADPNAGGNSRKNLHQALHASLERLGTDYLDLYWVHAWDGLTPLDELLRALDDAVRAGKVLYVGFSNVPAWVVSRANTIAELRGWTRGVALQVHYNLIERTPERELVPCAEALGLALTAWSPLAGGALSGKYSPDAAQRAAQPGRLTQTTWGRFNWSDRNLAIIGAARDVAQRLGGTPAQVAVEWLRRRPGNVIPILGARSEAQLLDLLGADRVTLDAEALAKLEEASRIELGYPAALLSGEFMKRMVHGEKYPDIDARR